MFRLVQLPSTVPGKLFLDRMPGRAPIPILDRLQGHTRETLEDVIVQLQTQHIKAIVCLAGIQEIRTKSPRYADALDAGSLPCPVLRFEIPDFGAPSRDRRDTFWKLAKNIAVRLRAGENILIHCGGGIGRTGMFANCVLLALGETPAAAQAAIANAGSHPETNGQKKFISWCASQPLTSI